MDMIALKEWNIVCRALEEGKQILLLRKGGIMEYRDGFEVKHNKFLLYPTFEHQSNESLKEKYKKEFGENIVQDKKRNEIDALNGINTLRLFARIHDVIEISDKKVLTKLDDYHIWDDKYVLTRMDYNPNKPLSVLLLRVFKIREPLVVDIQDQWSGCKSWINIELDKLDKLNRNNSIYKNELNTIEEMMRDDKATHKKEIIDPVLDENRFYEIVSGIKEVLPKV